MYLKNNIKLSLVIPCYNEVNNIKPLLERCNILAINHGIEIILVNNGSTDQSQSVLMNAQKYYQFKLVNVIKNIGYGYGILEGLKAASGDYIGWTHADLQTDPMDILACYEDLNDQFIFVKGLRFGRPLIDTIFTFFMSIFETILFHQAMWDICAQPTIFHRSFYMVLKNKNPPYDFSLDLFTYNLAKSYGLNFIRFPVRFAPRLNGVSSWDINWYSKLKHSYNTIKYSIKLKFSND